MTGIFVLRLRASFTLRCFTLWSCFTFRRLLRGLSFLGCHNDTPPFFIGKYFYRIEKNIFEFVTIDITTIKKSILQIFYL